MTNTTETTPKPAEPLIAATTEQKATGSIPESSLRWLAEQEEDWSRRQRGQRPPIVKFDSWHPEEIPFWQLIDLEEHYRKGFYHGMVEAIDLIYRMKHKGGYLRPDEIANMLSNWCTELRKWKRDVWHEDPIQNMTTPTLKWETWASMKNKCHERDGWACTECGAKEKLEAHHIESVRDGGVPDLDNLTTLCKSCHQSL